MKRFMLTAAVIAAAAVTLTACNDAEIASANISRAADNFEVMRRVVFMNGITDNYMLEIIGLCSINDRVTSVQVTCKVGEDRFIRHQMGLSDNVTYVAEQLDAIDVSVDHYRVTFKPQAIIPDIDLRGSFDSLINDDSDTMNQ
jgi:predicted small secreted protein